MSIDDVIKAVRPKCAMCNMPARERHMTCGDANCLERYLADSSTREPKVRAKSTRTPTRPARWGAACAKMREAISELESLKEEYQDWKDNIPESLQQGNLWDKLETIEGLDIDNLASEIEEIENTELPRGFGKD